MMGKPLEKWYLWDGKETVRVHSLLWGNGKISDISLFISAKMNYTGSDKNFRIVAYTLGEPVESKRGAKSVRLICDGCDGLCCAADFNGGEVAIYEDELCPDCNGKGYTLGTAK